jgi:mono/diheme cytochrome c family protein
MRILITAAAALAMASTCFGQEPAKKIVKSDIEYTNPTSSPEMFRAYCAACHGADAKGTGPAASALKKAPADLTILTRKNNGKFPLLAVQNTIRGDTATAAHGSRDMPVWGTLFRSVSAGQAVVDLRVRNLTDYLKGIQEK